MVIPNDTRQYFAGP